MLNHRTPSPVSSPLLFPRRATLFCDDVNVTVGNAAIIVATTGQTYGFYLSRTPSPANLDAWTSSFWLAAGVYTLGTLGASENDCGQVDYYIDDVKVISAQDWYSASPTFMVTNTATVNVARNGNHVLKTIVNGKNGSSVSPFYRFLPTMIWFAPGSD